MWNLIKLHRNDPWVVPFQSFFKDSNSMQNSGCHDNQNEKIKQIFLSKITGPIYQNNLAQWTLGDPLPRLFKLY